MTDLTDRQAEALRCCWYFYKANDQLPPFKVLAGLMGIKNTNGAVDHMWALERKGYLKRNDVNKYMFSDLGRKFLEGYFT